ncbi:MAG: Gfo/Idh/MocA family protein [Thermotogota bacterium]
MIESSKSSSGDVLRYGMVGGGPGSFIGDVHRRAIGLQGNMELVAGSFSSEYQETLETAESLHIDKKRAYKDYKEMAEKESEREDCIDFVSIVTPNFLHYDVAKTFLENGINVVCEKPMVFKIEEAEELEKIATEKGLIFAVSYTYSGNVMVKQAKEMVDNGEIGEVRMVMGEYPQDWLATKLENEGNRQASWRTDPSKAGISNVVGDIGSHIENTVAFITGLKIKKLCAVLDTFVEGRPLDDNAQILVKYDNGASGVYWCSQIAIGNDNGLKVRIYGTKGSLEWEQEDPNHLKFTKLGKNPIIMSRGRADMEDLAEKYSRLPAGHPEGYFEAYANLYSAIYEKLTKKTKNIEFTTVSDGLNGVKFINKVVESHKRGNVWVEL